jgi:hypothetical protein
VFHLKRRHGISIKGEANFLDPQARIYRVATFAMVSLAFDLKSLARPISQPS